MIISVEGLKGTGKSLLVEKLKGCVEMEVLPKFTRGFAAYPVWLEEIKQGYQQPFVDECFGFRWCANFFASLAEYQEDKVVLVEKGLISLGCSGLFGHLMYSHLPYVQYKVQMARVFNQYIAKYQPYVAQTMFIVVHADEGNMKHR
ncbi:MAG: hypothetical protein Q7R96_05615, partial [Nanoarchaeota archaeon]|nr:hypothetical protein [Nanoarchaeota archaeon]